MIEIRNILCPVDFSPISRRNLRMAVEMATRIRSRIGLAHSLDVRPPGYLSVSWMWSEDHESKEEQKAAEVPSQLEELFAEIPEGIEYEAKVSRGPMDTALLYLAEELPADLVIMGTHGRSSADHDSLTERIIIESPCSVLTIGEGYQPEEVFDAEHTMALEAMKFLIPVDFSTRSRKVLDFAFAVGESMPHSVDLLHVVKEGKGAQDSAQRDREVEAIRKRLEGRVPESLVERATVHVRVGDPVEEILKTADEIDALCIVMGSHGKSLLKRFLFGTTTMSILHRAKCPVWFVSEAVQKKLARSRFVALDS